MAKNIESQGVRVGYIIGGILALFLSAFLTILYLPSFLSSIFGIPLLWDLYDPIASVLTSNIMDLFEAWGVVGIFAVLFLLYFICFAARPSKSATMFRLTGIFGVLGISLPFVSTAVNNMVGLDLSDYIGYAMLGLWVLCLLFYILGLVFRAKQPYHKNKASTTLVFCVTFWLLMLTFLSIYYVGVAFGITALIDALGGAVAIVTTNMFAILGLFMLIAGIWMLLTIPHHVRVEYNADTPDLSKDGRPKIIKKDESALTPEQIAEAQAKSAEAVASSGAPTTQPLNVYPDNKEQYNHSKAQAKILQNPYKRTPIQPIPVSPQMAPANRPAFNQPFSSTPPTFNQPRPTIAPNGQPVAQNPMQPRQVASPFNNQPRPAAPNGQQMITPQNPYNNVYNNYQNAYNNRPQAPNMAPNMGPNSRMQPNPAFNQPTQQPMQPQRPQINRPIMPNQPQQPVRPANFYNPNMAPNNFGNQGNAYNQPFNPQNNPNNVIPNNLRPNNNGNNNN